MQEATTNSPLRVLQVAASGRRKDSVSRMLSADLIGALEARHGVIELLRRDLTDGMPFVDEAWISANFTAPEDRSIEQRVKLAESDALVAELQAADVIVIGAEQLNSKAEESIDGARARIAELVYTAPAIAARAV